MAALRATVSRLALAASLSWWMPAVAFAAPAQDSPPPAETTAAPPETTAAPPESPPPAESPAPEPDPATAAPDAADDDDDDDDGGDDDDDDDADWGGGFSDLGDDDDDDGELDELGDTGPEPAIGTTPSSQLVTRPGAELTLEPPVRVGPSGNPRHKWIYSNLTALRYNPLGATNDFKTGHRLQVIDKDSVLFRESYLLSGVRVFATPAYTRLGPHIEFQPLALLNLYAGYNFVGYYSTFDLIQSFPTATSDYSDTRLIERGDAGENYPTYGAIADISALVQAKVGPIAIRNNLVFYWANMRLRNGDRVWYDQFMDVAFPAKGWGLTNDADLIYLFPDSGLKLALRHSLIHVFYDEDDFLPGEPVTKRVNSPHHRIGPGILYTFYDVPTQRFNKPTIVILTQWFFQHRFRVGQDVHPAVPQIVLALTFQGDLMPHPRRRRIDRKGRERKAQQDALGPTQVPDHEE